MNIVRAFVGVHDLQIHQMARDAVFVGDAVAAVHIARDACNLQRLAATVALHDRGDFGRGAALVFEPPQAQAALQSEADFGLHIGELFLDQLIRRERATELLTLHDIASRTQPAILGRAERAPRNAVTRRIETGERPFQAERARQLVFVGDEHLVHDDFAGDRCA